MTNSLDDFISSLEGTDPVSRPAKADAPKYPCGQCAGTGFFQGVRVHQEKAHCFACRGKGYFTKSPEHRAASKARRDKRKACAREAIAELVEQFAIKHPDLYAELKAVRYHHEGARSTEFLVSLASQLFEKGGLTEPQIVAWYRGREKYLAMIEQRKAEAEKAKVEVDLTPIRAMFERVAESGYKKPKYRAEGLVLSLAPSSGRNPGAIYVKDENDVYLGKILGTTFSPSREGAEAGQTLMAISSDPLEAALRYGQRTGACACCGRKLTAHGSIDLGIGPVCKDRWGL